MPGAYTLSHLAYLKIILHAAKYPHDPVNGVLLSASPLSSPEVFVSDAIPLLHQWTSLSPMMEIALMMVEGYAKEHNLRVVGYYEASERAQDTSIGPVGDRVLAKLKASNTDAFAVVLDAGAVADGDAGLIPYVTSPNVRAVQEPLPFTVPPPSQGQHSTVTSRPSAPTFHLVSADSPGLALIAIRDQHLHRSLGDFDDHLEDVSIDWMQNSSITKAEVPS